VSYINTLSQQKTDVIVVSANDKDAICGALNEARQAGAKVVTYDSDTQPSCRDLFINQATAEGIASSQIKLISDAVGPDGGEIAILSATAQATNQNIWIAEMKKVLAKPEYSKLKLVATVYGDDQSDKSYREALGLLRSNPKLKVIVAPTTVGINAAAKAVADEKLIGKVYVTGLGLPSEMAGHVMNGSVKTFAIWNPIDLGYSATYVAYQFVKGKATGKQGEQIPAGRMGKSTVEANGEAAMAQPFTFDKSNVEKFAKMF
jgi:rhamnose transport system substrate-binding protein